MADLYLICPRNAPPELQGELREPTPGQWYVGVTPAGEWGAVAQYDGAYFLNSESPDMPGVDMSGYDYLVQSGK